ncbi:hypothetical protein GEMRC1_012203 [Eukaryota sp. GEM-RC1]
MFRIVVFIIVFVTFVNSCDYSIPSSSCKVTGGLNPTCQRERFVIDGVSRYFASCYASGAEYCELSYFNSFCSTSGQNSKCAVDTRSVGQVTHISAFCSSENAKSCSQQLYRHSCSIIGESSLCSSTWLEGQHPYYVPTCESHRGLQCSITCATSSCDQTCTGHASAFCKCVIDDEMVGLAAKCGCK